MSSLSQPQLDLLALSGGVLFLCYLYYRGKGTSHLPLPPGPKALPIVGNIFSLQKGKLWETYSRWQKEYGDVVYIHYFGTSVIILNTFKAVNELLEKRSSISSGRPYFTMFNELMDFGRGTVFKPYGNIWRKHRTLYHKYFNQIAVKEFYPPQLVASRRFLRMVLNDPHDFVHHIRHMAASVVMGIAYGRDILPKSDPMVALSDQNVQMLAQALRPGAFLVDTFPILKYVPAWVPGAGFQKFGQKARKSYNAMRDIPFKDLKAQLIAGTARPSLAANAVTELGIDDESNEDVEVIKSVSGSLFGAGTDTTASTLHSFILAMVLYPDVPRKAQEELDRVVGNGRLPDFIDRPDLPYIEAIVKEVFRWMPIVPTGVPHVTTEDDTYEGYYIPANTILLANSWNILRDPDMYPEPSVFRPERFLPEKDEAVPRDPAIGGTFGFGRRACAGRHLADSAVWIAVASMLSVFNITNAVDENGRQIDVTYASDPNPGTLIRPCTFPCAITPRSPEAIALIKSTEE